MSDISRRGFLIASGGVGLTALAPMASAQAATDLIAITYQQQSTQSWCSAAATRIALSASGRLPSQAVLAKALGLVDGEGLQDVQNDMPPVINRRLDRVGQRFRYRFFNDMNRFDEYVRFGCSQDKPIVYNVDQVAGQPYKASGHYICITGRRTANGGIQYRIADPDSPARTGNWYNRPAVQSWNKFGRYVAFS